MGTLLRILTLLYLLWVPIPFGSVTGFAQLPLVAVPLLLLVLALFSPRIVGGATRTTSWAVATAAGVAMLVLAAIQLAPLSPNTVRLLSPESFRIWSDADRAGTLIKGGDPAIPSFPSRYRITVAPEKTREQAFRFAGFVAAFQLGFLLFGDSRWRRRLTAVVIVSAAAQVLYGFQELASGNQYGMHSVLGWTNQLIFRRASGTFVNPNHFAMYVAIALPLAISALLSVWRKGTTAGRALSDRLSHFLSHGLVWFILSALSVIVSVAGILISQSRAVLAAALAGLMLQAVLTALLALRGAEKKKARRAPFGVLAGVLLVAITALWMVHRLGPERTTARLLNITDQKGSAVGRTIGFEAAIAVWKHFPLLGSGLGTFENVVLMEQSMAMDNIFNHAHDDYLEILTTGGAAGLVIALAGLGGLWITLVRFLFGSSNSGGGGHHPHHGERRDFVAGCLTVLSIAMLHALVDFDLFIPAIPATIAVLLGAACAAARHHVRRQMRG